MSNCFKKRIEKQKRRARKKWNGDISFWVVGSIPRQQVTLVHHLSSYHHLAPSPPPDAAQFSLAASLQFSRYAFTSCISFPNVCSCQFFPIPHQLGEILVQFMPNLSSFRGFRVYTMVISRWRLLVVGFCRRFRICGTCSCDEY